MVTEHTHTLTHTHTKNSFTWMFYFAEVETGCEDWWWWLAHSSPLVKRHHAHPGRSSHDHHRSPTRSASRCSELNHHKKVKFWVEKYPNCITVTHTHTLIYIYIKTCSVPNMQQLTHHIRIICTLRLHAITLLGHVHGNGLNYVRSLSLSKCTCFSWIHVCMNESFYRELASVINSGVSILQFSNNTHPPVLTKTKPQKCRDTLTCITHEDTHTKFKVHPRVHSSVDLIDHSIHL